VKARSGVLLAQNLKGEEDQELIQWINSPTNGSPAPATKSSPVAQRAGLFRFPPDVLQQVFARGFHKSVLAQFGEANCYIRKEQAR